jgi:pilus assembly protein Flp/PilA
MLEKYLILRWALAHRREERGATATEYGLLVALVAFLIIIGVTTFGGALNDFFTALGNRVGQWSSGGGGIN